MIDVVGDELGNVLAALMMCTDAKERETSLVAGVAATRGTATKDSDGAFPPKKI